MTRKKVKLSYIIDDNARKATFKKRKKGIVKKVSELTILCGIDACAIISNPYDSQPEVWPNPKGAKNIIKKYLKTPVIDETKNMNQERFIIQKISKVMEKIDKQRNENREKQIARAMFDCMRKRKDLENFNVGELKDLDKFIDVYVKDIKRKIIELELA